jgi:NTE family protein
MLELAVQPIEHAAGVMTDMQALVLGGGGVAGIAWMTGVLAGLADAGQDVTDADVIIGTSAGATVAAQVGSGLPLDALYARQAESALQCAEISPVIDMAKLALVAIQLAGVSNPQDKIRRVGRFALEAKTVTEAERRAVIASRLPNQEWPSRPIKLVAADCESGETRVFDAASGVALVDAVAASCAVPCIWPPTTIGGHRFMDGGVRSPDNADLAAGAKRIVILSPLGLNPRLPSPTPLRDVVSRLRKDGSEVVVVEPDAASAAAIGLNPLDPATRTPAAKAGRAQGGAGLPSA